MAGKEVVTFIFFNCALKMECMPVQCTASVFSAATDAEGLAVLD